MNEMIFVRLRNCTAMNSKHTWAGAPAPQYTQPIVKQSPGLIPLIRIGDENDGPVQS